MDPFADLPVPRGLDPLYFDRRRSIEGALRWAGVKGQPRVCIDVGANVGQTMHSFLDWWPQARCISFEPLPAARTELEREAARWDGRAIVHPVGVSDKAETLTLHASRVQLSASSFRPVNRTAETAGAHRGLRGKPSHYEGDGEGDSYEVTVPVVTLDEHLAAAGQVERQWCADGIDVLKSDANCWDLAVMRGAPATLARTRVVLVEWQFDDIYGRPVPVGALDEVLTAAGLRLWDIAHVYKDLSSLRTLWVDLVYARPAVGGGG
jgi:FkbM family methyltransferase